jgi:hypothetical protein
LCQIAQRGELRHIIWGKDILASKFEGPDIFLDSGAAIPYHTDGYTFMDVSHLQEVFESKAGL